VVAPFATAVFTVFASMPSIMNWTTTGPAALPAAGGTLFCVDTVVAVSIRTTTHSREAGILIARM
jgi:hypothetical protein